MAGFGAGHGSGKSETHVGSGMLSSMRICKVGNQKEILHSSSKNHSGE